MTDLWRFPVCRGHKSSREWFWHRALFLYLLQGQLVIGLPYKPRKKDEGLFFVKGAEKGPLSAEASSRVGECFPSGLGSAFCEERTSLCCRCHRPILKKRKPPPRQVLQNAWSHKHSWKTAVRAAKLTLKELMEKPFRSWNCTSVHSPHRHQLRLPTDTPLYATQTQRSQLVHL